MYDFIGQPINKGDIILVSENTRFSVRKVNDFMDDFILYEIPKSKDNKSEDIDLAVANPNLLFKSNFLTEEDLNKPIKHLVNKPLKEDFYYLLDNGSTKSLSLIYIVKEVEERTYEHLINGQSETSNFITDKLIDIDREIKFLKQNSPNLFL